MDLKLEEHLIPTVVIACLIVGYVVKTTPLFYRIANDYIPLIVTLLGATLGAILNGVTVEGIVYGALSGLASTGLHQIFKIFVTGSDVHDRYE